MAASQYPRDVYMVDLRSESTVFAMKHQLRRPARTDRRAAQERRLRLETRQVPLAA
jgi:hypothetical protein